MKSLLQSFKYAFNGIGFAIYNERNMRIHVCVAVYIVLFSLFYHLSKTEYILLFLTIGMMFFAELVNTAIEYVVDLQSRKYNVYAKVAKDVSAGAVLVCAFVSVIVGFVLFFDVPTIKMIFNFLTHNIVFLIIFAISIFVAYYFIFKFGRKRIIRGEKWVQKVHSFQ